jgi:hypothetical protein
MAGSRRAGAPACQGACREGFPHGVSEPVRGGYRRGRPLNPPPPPLERRSVRPPPSRGRASFTFNVRPIRSFPLRPTIAACPSDAEGISTKPNPLGCPLYWSLMMLTDVTDPKGLKGRAEIRLGHVKGHVPHIDIHLRLPGDPCVAPSRTFPHPGVRPHAISPGSATSATPLYSISDTAELTSYGRPA